MTIVFSCCWWWDDVATSLAVVAAFLLHGYLDFGLRLVGAYYLIGIPVAEFVCLVILRLLVSNYWNVLISFSAYIIVLLLFIASDIRGAGYNAIMGALTGFYYGRVDWFRRICSSVNSSTNIFFADTYMIASRR